ncbi:NUDIX domain-containing protein [Patescibacteria group bacterium]|nr:NUDIX domain-containing protein [Patescibacteria group bacterium]MBU4580630.1 NUDIX domain-containing protein [Patescibacteria group bacterium]
MTKHFTISTIIVCKEKAFLHLHKKMDKWLPVGGYIERDELLEEAALREIKEESGLEIILYNPDKQVDMADAKQLIRTAHILLEDIKQDHQHIDFVYYATANSFDVKPEDGEVTDLKWFEVDEIKKLANVPKNVKICALEAIELLKVK